MAREAKVCTLCEQRWHKAPKRVKYGLTCPNDQAPQEDQDKFLAQWVERVFIEARYGLTLAKDADAVALISPRMQKARERFGAATRPQRSEVTIEALQKDCDERTAAAMRMPLGMVSSSERAGEATFDPYLPSLVTTTKRLTRPPGLTKVRRGNLSPDSDAELYVDPTSHLNNNTYQV